MAELIIHQEKVTDNQELVKICPIWGNGRKKMENFRSMLPVRCAAFV